MWLNHELVSVFGVADKLNGQSAQRIYDQIADRLASPEFRPRRLFEQFNIEVMSTTEIRTTGATDRPQRRGEARLHISSIICSQRGRCSKAFSSTSRLLSVSSSKTDLNVCSAKEPRTPGSSFFINHGSLI
jgi:hypothetical protein